MKSSIFLALVMAVLFSTKAANSPPSMEQTLAENIKIFQITIENLNRVQRELMTHRKSANVITKAKINELKVLLRLIYIFIKDVKPKYTKFFEHINSTKVPEGFEKWRRTFNIIVDTIYKQIHDIAKSLKLEPFKLSSLDNIEAQIDSIKSTNKAYSVLLKDFHDKLKNANILDTFKKEKEQKEKEIKSNSETRM